MYQNPNFNKEDYWKRRNIEIERLKKGIIKPKKVIKYNQAVVGNKPITKKAMLKNTKRARKLQFN